jgi:hypothetical protein
VTPQWPKFRLTLDKPYDFAVEPGIVRAVHCHDFREDELSLKDGAWRCPVTGLVFLTPSWLSEEYNAQFEPLASWTKNADLWREAKRVQDKYTVAGGSGLLNAPMLSSVYPASTGGVISWGGSLGAVAASLLSLMNGDELEWALVSDFNLAEDEGFVLHLNAIGDPIRRHKNWIALQWDNLQVHIRPNGVMALYRWDDREDMSDLSTLKLVEEYQMSSPGEVGARDSYVLFLPIPTMGLLVYHSYTPQRLSQKISSARAGSVRGHLFSLPSEEREDSEGNYRLTASSSMGIALTKTPRVAHMLGFHRLRFPNGGSYLDAIYSPPYRPTNSPDQADPILLATGRPFTVAPSGDFRKVDDSADWDATDDRQGRVKVILTPDSGNVYTPFVLGTYLRWGPIFATRTTKPLRLTPDGGRWNDLGTGQKDTQDFLQYLEFTQTDEKRFEGKARIYCKSLEGKRILERGDATWEIERLDDDEAEWEFVCGGIARWESSSISVNSWDSGDDDSLSFGKGTRRRVAYQGEISLYDGWHRFTEVHQCNQTAFDRLTIHQAIDTVLLASGQPALSGTIPTLMDTVALPAVPKGENWRHGTQEGDDGGQIIRQLLLYLRKQFTQYRLVNNWSAGTWGAESYSRLTGESDTLWWMTPDYAEASGATDPDGAPDVEFRIEIGTGETALFTFKAYPPEANLIRPFGLEKPGPDAKRIMGPPMVNQASLSDDTSRDYLGRACVANPMLAPLSEESVIARFGRLVYDAIAHRRLVVSVPVTGYLKDFTPGSRVSLRSFNEEGDLYTVFDAWWMRRKTTVIDYLSKGDIITSLYTLDEQWDTPLD